MSIKSCYISATLGTSFVPAAVAVTTTTTMSSQHALDTVTTTNCLTGSLACLGLLHTHIPSRSTLVRAALENGLLR